MNNNIFKNKLLEIENVFNSKYSDGQVSFIWNMIYKWRESTFLMVVYSLCENFKPYYGVPLPLPAHFNEIRTQLNIQEDQEWKKQADNSNNLNDPNYLKYQSQVSEWLKKMTGSEEFKLKTAFIDGKFCCDLCQRNGRGCSAHTEKAMQNGCPGFLSEAAFKKIQEKELTK